MSLNDLLKDLEDDEPIDNQNDTNSAQDATMAEEESVSSKPAEPVGPTSLERDYSNVYDLKDIYYVYGSSNLKELLKDIEHYQQQPRGPNDVIGTMETDPEYILLMKANKMLVDVQNEIQLLRHFIRDHYNKRNPGLNEMIPGAAEYAKTVKRLGNNPDVSSIDLSDILPSAYIMGVALSTTGSVGSELPEKEIQIVFTACDSLIELDEIHSKILSYVESRILFLAPNLAHLIGTTITAKLIAIAGGLLALARLPANVIQILGPRPGLISTCDLITKTPQEFQLKATRLLAGKVALAARSDSQQSGTKTGGTDDTDNPFVEEAINLRNGKVGDQLREQVEKAIDHWLEPPPLAKQKAMKAPGSKIHKRRGGKRMRRLHERLGQTEVRKQLNRVAFGGQEEVDPLTGEGFGMLGSKDAMGKLVYAGQDRGILKKSKQKAAQFFRNSGSTMNPLQRQTITSGSATSLKLSSGQGIELVLPEDQKQRFTSGTESVYFNATSGFQSVVPKQRPQTNNYFK